MEQSKKKVKSLNQAKSGERNDGEERISRLEKDLEKMKMKRRANVILVQVFTRVSVLPPSQTSLVLIVVCQDTGRVLRSAKERRKLVNLIHLLHPVQITPRSQRKNIKERAGKFQKIKIHLKRAVKRNLLEDLKRLNQPKK